MSSGKLVKHTDTRDSGLGLLQQLVVAGGICVCICICICICICFCICICVSFCIFTCSFRAIQGGSGDEDMTSLLDLLHSCPITNLTLRTEILRCLMAALKESHR